MRKILRFEKWMYIFFTISFLTIIVMWLMFDYVDLDSMTVWSLNFWECIFNKELGLKHFYEYTGLNIHNLEHTNCDGNYLFLIPWSIWNFPLWIITKCVEVGSYTNFWFLFWSKLFLVCSHLGITYLSIKISEKIDGTKKEITTLLVFSAPEILISYGYAGQNEVVYLFTFLLAIYLVLCNKWWLAYICCIITVVICPIMILPVSIIYLYKSKNLIKIIGFEIGSVLPLLLFEMLYYNDLAYHGANNLNSVSYRGPLFFEDMLMYTGIGYTTPCIILVICAFFWIYTRDKSNPKDLILGIALVTLIVNFTMDDFFYRYLLYVPFMAIIVTWNYKSIDMNIFLMTLLAYSRTYCALIIEAKSYFNTQYVMKNSWVTWICDKFGSNKYLSEYSCHFSRWFLEKESTAQMVEWGIVAVCVSCVILLLYINCLKREQEFRLELDYKKTLGIYVLCMPMVIGLFWMRLL